MEKRRRSHPLYKNIKKIIITNHDNTKQLKIISDLQDKRVMSKKLVKKINQLQKCLLCTSTKSRSSCLARPSASLREITICPEI
jgi:hypothetical protein